MPLNKFKPRLSAIFLLDINRVSVVNVPPIYGICKEFLV